MFAMSSTIGRGRIGLFSNLSMHRPSSISDYYYGYHRLDAGQEINIIFELTNQDKEWFMWIWYLIEAWHTIIDLNFLLYVQYRYYSNYKSKNITQKQTKKEASWY